jgi:hypothetical protein
MKEERTRTNGALSPRTPLTRVVRKRGTHVNSTQQTGEPAEFPAHSRKPRLSHVIRGTLVVQKGGNLSFPLVYRTSSCPRRRPLFR